MQGPWGEETGAGKDSSLPGAARSSRGGSTAQVVLDPVFTDNSRLSEAATLVEKMLPLAREVSYGLLIDLICPDFGSHVCLQLLEHPLCNSRLPHVFSSQLIHVLWAQSKACMSMYTTVRGLLNQSGGSTLQVHLSNKRLGLVTDELDKAASGTVEAALRNLIAYRSSLENRLLTRFMDACSQSVRS
jgi:hypothetical protein